MNNTNEIIASSTHMPVIPSKRKKKLLDKFVDDLEDLWTEEEALVRLNINNSNWLFSVFLTVNTISILGNVTVGVALLGGWTAMGILFGLLVSSFGVISFVDEKIAYNKEKVLKYLSEVEKEKVISLIELNERRAALLKEYNDNHEVFIEKYFGAYTPDISVVIKHELDMDKKGYYIVDIANPESTRHQNLKNRITLTKKV